ncbi:arsenate reductase/protein-tyrosine-phosphatase family protein [Demequina activiva]|uniref:Protein-tyrosine-phosphatase n=1 Tax=Demequina activiva TaxID=1582364 RepID=A0A919Q207_9MICO|nr:low molecular weight phosphatase family protein [Demequina activiva]GIG53792.1 protein-tyrosine-phosphatase [Demequina activiva]
MVTRVLTVCTGNICRSPAAALLLEHYLGELVTTASAGTHALVGHGIPTSMRECLAGAGIDGSHHVAQMLTPAIAREHDIVIAMTAPQRIDIVRQTPGVLRRTFLLDELALAARAQMELAGETPRARLADVPHAIQRFRPQLAVRDVRDIPDPYGGSSALYEEVFEAIASSIEDLRSWIRA